MAGQILRTANLIAEMPQRKIAGGITTVVPNGGIKLAMGRVPDSCVLTLGVGDTGATIAISCYIYSGQAFADSGNGWLKAGAAVGKYQLSFEVRGCDSWDIPEGTPYCLVGASAVNPAYVRDRPL